MRKRPSITRTISDADRPKAEHLRANRTGRRARPRSGAGPGCRPFETFTPERARPRFLLVTTSRHPLVSKIGATAGSPVFTRREDNRAPHNGGPSDLCDQICSPRRMSDLRRTLACSQGASPVCTRGRPAVTRDVGLVKMSPAAHRRPGSPVAVHYGSASRDDPLAVCEQWPHVRDCERQPVGGGSGGGFQPRDRAAGPLRALPDQVLSSNRVLGALARLEGPLAGAAMSTPGACRIPGS